MNNEKKMQGMGMIGDTHRSLRGLEMPRAASGDPRKRAAKKTTTKKAAPGITGRARPRPTAVTSTDEWLADQQGQLVELPSGKVVRMIMPGMQAFVRADIIPNELMPLVLKAIDEQEPMSEQDVRDLQKDPAILLKMADAFDGIFIFCVVEPRFELAPTPEDVELYNSRHPDEPVEGPDELRVRGTLYVDRVNMDDKAYVFQCAVGGTRDLETFRAESRAQLEAVSASQDM